MPDVDKNHKLPRLEFLDETITFSDFTDGGSTAGTFDLRKKLPARCLVGHPIGVEVLEKFIGDVSAALIVGTSSDTDRFVTSTLDAFTATGLIEPGIVSGAKLVASETTVRVTVTTNADFTSVSAGRARIVIPFVRLP